MTPSAPRTSCAATLGTNDLRLYELIWRRTVASQMVDARGSTATVVVGVTAAGRKAEFTASGTVITVRGFLLAYEEGRDEERNAESDADAKLPQLTTGQALTPREPEANGHETSPPPRYTEASLVKALEELGIGRPSTYASILSTIVDRGYVSARGTALVPNWIAFSVVRLLEEFFGDLVAYDFTAEMENDLDRIADGEQDRVDWLREFYFGVAGHPGLRGVVDNLGDIDAKSINSIRLSDDITLRIGKYGPYLEVVEAGEPAVDRERRAEGDEHLAARQPAAGPRARRAHRGEGARARVGAAAGGPGARCAPGDRPDDRREGRPIRPLRDRDHPGGRGRQEGCAEAADRLAVQVDVARLRRPGDRRAAAGPAARGRERPRERRADHGAERPVRAVPEEGHRHPHAAR